MDIYYAHSLEQGILHKQIKKNKTTTKRKACCIGFCIFIISISLTYFKIFLLGIYISNIFYDSVIDTNKIIYI